MAYIADDIREFAGRTIQRARAEGRELVLVKARDVHDGLNLQAAFPNVCQALQGRKFLTQYNVRVREIFGPCPSSTTEFAFQLN